MLEVYNVDSFGELIGKDINRKDVDAHD